MTFRTLARILLMTAITATLVAALWPAAEVPRLASGNVPHILAFAVLTLLTFMAFPRMGFLLTWSLLIFLGGAIELLQWVMGFGRAAQWEDLLADATAIIVVMSTFVVCRAVLQWMRADASECQELAKAQERPNQPDF